LPLCHLSDGPWLSNQSPSQLVIGDGLLRVATHYSAAVGSVPECERAQILGWAAPLQLALLASQQCWASQLVPAGSRGSLRRMHGGELAEFGKGLRLNLFLDACGTHNTKHALQ